MSELIPKGIRKGKDVVTEGKKIGNTFEIGVSAFQKERGCTLSELREAERQKGNVLLLPQMGLSTVQEQVEAMRELYETCKKRGVDASMMIITSNMLNGLPPELRANAPKGTSFVLDGPEDFERIAQAAPILPLFADHMVGTPNSVSNVINALKAGAPGIGTMSQYSWNYPYWHDDVGQVVETVKALGILASKRKAGAGIGSYVGDGTSASFIDHASEVGYCLFEQYVVETLCGAKFTTGLGGLISHIPSKMATWLAVNDVMTEALNTKEIILNHMEGNTLEVTEDAESNWVSY
ncbi:MAG: hypothetical protein D4R38_02885 [Dehalococcoidia bacterium]|nr:MAG: hypothetical protein D4R38_02885 [Dehalococcoidia bacterium]